MGDARGKTALITGASGGIGYELARRFARGGYNLALVARSEDKLVKIGEELSAQYGIEAGAVVRDLTEPNAPDAIFQALNQEGIEIDVLVNNAGFGTHGFFHETDANRQIAMLELNVLALTRMTRLFLPMMIERGSGRILNVASTAAYQPGPLMAVYCASKAYVLSFTQAVANEAAGHGVVVTCLCPGPASTGFQEASKMGRPRIFRTNLLDAERVADVGYKALMRGKRVAVVGKINKLMAFGTRFMPNGMLAGLLRYLLTNPDESKE